MNWKIGYEPESELVALVVTIENNGKPGEATFLIEPSEARKLSDHLRMTVETIENRRQGPMQ